MRVAGVEITICAVLILGYTLGVLVGRVHMFVPVRKL